MLDLAKDEIGTGSPQEGFGIPITLVEIIEHGLLQLPDGGMTAATDASFCHFGK